MKHHGENTFVQYMRGKTTLVLSLFIKANIFL